jgi:hypothetical protein
MAGAVFVSPTSAWSSSSWIFYWVVDTLADIVSNELLSEKLREISEFHLGSLSLEEFEPHERAEILRAIAGLPQVAIDTLPESSGRDSVLAQIAELVLLCEDSSPTARG